MHTGDGAGGGRPLSSQRVPPSKKCFTTARCASPTVCTCVACAVWALAAPARGVGFAAASALSLRFALSASGFRVWGWVGGGGLHQGYPSAFGLGEEGYLRAIPPLSGWGWRATSGLSMRSKSPSEYSTDARRFSSWNCRMRLRWHTSKFQYPVAV